MPRWNSASPARSSSTSPISDPLSRFPASGAGSGRARPGRRVLSAAAGRVVAVDTNGVAERHLAAVLAATAGPAATPRPDQVEAVAALVGGRRVLLVQATGWGKSAVYWAATAALREAGRGPTLVISPLLALMRDQVAAAGRAGLRAATVNSANVADWQPVVRRARRRRDRRAAGLPRAAGQPAVRRHGAAAAGQDRPAGRRRGALHLRLGLRLPARLPAADPPARRDRARQPGAGHHGDRQRQGHRRRRRPARGRHAGAARSAGPRLAAAVGRARAGRGGAVRLGRRRAGRAARLRHRLRADRRPGPLAGRVPGRAGSPGRGLHRADRAGRAGPDRGGAASQRAQGGGGDLRARHGLRQARPRLLRARRLARLPGGLLPAGRPGRPGAGRGGRRAAAGGRERPTDLGLVRDRDDPRPGRGPPGARAAADRAGRRAVRCRRSRPRPGCAAAGSTRC